MRERNIAIFFYKDVTHNMAQCIREILQKNTKNNQIFIELIISHETTLCKKYDLLHGEALYLYFLWASFTESHASCYISNTMGKYYGLQNLWVNTMGKYNQL